MSLRSDDCRRRRCDPAAVLRSVHGLRLRIRPASAADAGLEAGRLRVERGGRGVQSARSCATWQVRFISVGRLFWVSHEHVSTVAFNRHAVGVSPPRRGAAATGRALAVLASDRVRARRRRSDRRRGGEGGRGGDYGCRCTEMMAILASSPLDRQRS